MKREKRLTNFFPVIPYQQLTFFDNIKERLDKPVFAASMKHNAPGSFDFGYLDKKKYEGEIAYTPVDGSENHWTVTFSGFSTGGVDNSTRIRGVVGTFIYFIHQSFYLTPPILQTRELHFFSSLPR